MKDIIDGIAVGIKTYFLYSTIQPWTLITCMATSVEKIAIISILAHLDEINMTTLVTLPKLMQNIQYHIL